MTKFPRWSFMRVAAGAGALLAVSVLPASADAVAEFYRGKQVQIVIGYGTGGGYDAYARLFARHLGRHIPGNPAVITQNMPGAGSRKAANWLFQVAPKDGTVLAMLAQTTPIEQALGQPQIRFDVRQFNWIGNLVAVNNVMIVSAQTGVRTIEDAKNRSLAMGASGANSPSAMYPSVSNNLLGTQFKIVSGYLGGGDIMIALERGELDGRGSDSWASLKANNPAWIREGKVNILFQVGPRREPDLPDVTLWSELGQNDEQRQVLEILSGDVAVGRPILAPPGVVDDRVRALRKAFDDTMMDPAYLAAAKKANMYLNPIAGEELHRIVNRIVDASPAAIEKLKAAITSKDRLNIRM
jgi:tripartite-type tricarboxylate transporter receptor subunit TctC